MFSFAHSLIELQLNNFMLGGAGTGTSDDIRQEDRGSVRALL